MSIPALLLLCLVHLLINQVVSHLITQSGFLNPEHCCSFLVYLRSLHIYVSCGALNKYHILCDYEALCIYTEFLFKLLIVYDT